MKAILSEYSHRKKINYFISTIPKKAKVLEVGCGDGALRKYMKKGGWKNYQSLDLFPPADFVGDIKRWKKIGLKKSSFDFIIAFELVEHVDCFREFFDLLKPGGFLFLTSPKPSTDWICKILELAGVSQKRSSSHDHLINFRKIPFFEPIDIKIVGMLAQWGKFKKPKQKK